MVDSRIALGILAFADGFKFDLFCRADIIYTSGNCSDQKKHNNINHNSFCVWCIWILSFGFGTRSLEK
jgi:hypothetical protein